MAINDNLPGYDELSRAFNPGKPATGPMEAFSKGLDLADTLIQRRRESEDYDRKVKAFQAKYVPEATAIGILKQAGVPDDDRKDMLAGMTFPMNIDDLKDLIAKYKERTASSKTWTKIGEGNMFPGIKYDTGLKNVDGTPITASVLSPGFYAVERQNSTGEVRTTYLGELKKDEKKEPALKNMPQGEKKELFNALGVGYMITRLAETWKPGFTGLAQWYAIEGKKKAGTINPDEAKFYVYGYAFKNKTIKDITGAQMSEAEAKRITSQLPDPSDNDDAFISEMETAANDAINGISMKLDAASGVYNPASVPSNIRNWETGKQVGLIDPSTGNYVSGGLLDQLRNVASGNRPNGTPMKGGTQQAATSTGVKATFRVKKR